jgi:hypothetical protein
VAEEAARQPALPVRVWASDEHRLGLKPVMRRVWAPVGQRPVALGHHRFVWRHVTAFVEPDSGTTEWFVSDSLCKPLFEGMLAAFADAIGAGRTCRAVVVLDNAGWHTAPLAVPDGVRLVHLPPYSPELQPAETLWPLVDEPVVNRHIADLAELDRLLDQRCHALGEQTEVIRSRTSFHWWPTTPKLTHTLN